MLDETDAKAVQEKIARLYELFPFDTIRRRITSLLEVLRGSDDLADMACIPPPPLNHMIATLLHRTAEGRPLFWQILIRLLRHLGAGSCPAAERFELLLRLFISSSFSSLFGFPSCDL